MAKWHGNKKTTLPKEMQQESQLPNNKGNIDDAIVEMVTSQTGELANLTWLSLSLKDLLERAQQSNSATPVMAEVLSYALLATVNRLTSMCDQLKTSISILLPYSKTTQRVGLLVDNLNDVIAFADSIIDDI